MCGPFKFLLFILAIQRYRSVDCYVPGSLIWNRNLQKFIPVANVSTFGAYEQEIVAKSREKEKHNFQGAVLKLGSVQDDNMVNFIDNDTKITGICGEIWNTLAEYSNFTLVTTKLESFMPTVENWQRATIAMIATNEIQIVPRMACPSAHSDLLDCTTPIWKTKYRIYIKPEWKSDTNWMFNIFERKVWFAIIFCFLLLSALGYLMQNISIKVSGDTEQRHSLHDHLFYTFAAFCSQGFIPETLDRRSQILGVSKKIFAWLLLIVLSSHVISHMTNVKLQPPFEDIESMLKDTDYEIGIFVSSPAVLEYMTFINNLSINMDHHRVKRRTMTELTQKLLHSVTCHSDKRALFEMEDTKQAFGSPFCEMVAVGKSYFPTWIAFGISKGFKYKRTFDIGILKMREFGLIDRLKNRWLKTSAGPTGNSENLGHASFTPVSLDQVLRLFLILCIGIVASAVIFVVEVIVSIYKSNQRRPVREKGLIGKAGLNAHRLPAVNYQNNRPVRGRLGKTRLLGKTSLNAPRLPTVNCKKNRMTREIELSDLTRMTVYVQNVFVVDRRNFARRSSLRE